MLIQISLVCPHSFQYTKVRHGRMTLEAKRLYESVRKPDAAYGGWEGKQVSRGYM